MSIQTKLAKFNFVTVMNPTFYENNNGLKGDLLFELDSLRLANITQEGPTKTAKGGLYANTKLRYGKTMRLEMEDVMGRVAVLEALMGVVYSSTSPTTHKESYVATAGQEEFTVTITPTAITLVEKNDRDLVLTDDYTVSGAKITLVVPATAGDVIQITYTSAGSALEKYSITDKFADAVWIEGETFVIDGNGDKQWVKLVIPSFLPDSTFNISLESEGDIGVININGDIQANACGEFMWFEDDTGTHNC